MYNLELHYLLARVTLFLLLATSITGAMLLVGKPEGWRKRPWIVHIVAGVLMLLFFLLTYLLAPKI